MNFNHNWLKWIRSCVCSNSLSFLVNEIPVNDFASERGLCQGDLLSLFLFIIALEGLMGLLNLTIFQKKFHPLRLYDDLQFDNL